MNFNNHNWSCHSERSEESASGNARILRCAQNDRRIFEEVTIMSTVERRASLTWEGNLLQGHGTIVQTSSGALANLPVTWASRTEQPAGKTSPEELIAAAHAECYAMGLAAGLARSGTPAEKLDVEAVCT